MDGLLAGKSIVITGAGSGVGREAALLFAAHGARVIATDVDADRIAETASLAGTAGDGTVRGIVCDVTHAEQVEAAIRAAVEAHGRLDIIYNNAGVTIQSTAGTVKTILNTTQDDIDRVMAINLSGVVNGCRAAIAQFDAQGGGGNIVITASVAGLIGFGGAIYGASKGAVTSLTRALAMEVAGRGIRVNAVCPAGMLTHFAGMDPDGANAEAIRSGMSKLYPMDRAIEPVECAKVALFLASDLSTGMTGTNIPVDAGLSAGVKPWR